MKRLLFLDDSSSCAIGKLDEMASFVSYKEAFVAIGDNELREVLLNRLFSCGYEIPTLVHPSAYVSCSASIAKGVLVEPHAIINTNAKIDTGSIISIGAVIDHDATLESCVHINAGTVISAGTTVTKYKKISANLI